MTTTLYTQPGCGGCYGAAAQLRNAGIAYTARDVRTDPTAAELVRELYAEHREPGAVPETPVTVIDGQPFFGLVELHAYLRQLARAAAAA